MTSFGYTLSSEEHGPTELVENAGLAEVAGFDFVSISDHYHPWVSAQGHSPFVWAVLGGIASTTERIGVGVGVTCPIVRVHPAIVAHAAATTSVMLGDRFFLGVGTGEALNEHVHGDRWPAPAIRREMLEEAVAVMRELWTGDTVEHRGRHYEVENARIFDPPTVPIPVIVSGFGPEAAALAGRIGDGYWGTHFEQASQLATVDDVVESTPVGPDIADELRASVDEYVDAGFDHLYFHQVGPDQRGFLEFWSRELQPTLDGLVGAGRD